MKYWPFILLTFLFLTSSANAKSKIEVTMLSGQRLDCSQSLSMPAACIDSDGTRYLVQVGNDYSNVLSITNKGDVGILATPKVVKVDNQIIYEVGPEQVSYDKFQSTPSQSSSNTSYRTDLEIYNEAYSNLYYLADFITDPVAKKLATQIDLIIQSRLERASKAFDTKNIEIETESGEKTNCKQVDQSGRLPCLIYSCGSDKKSFYFNNNITTPSLIKLDDKNHIKSNEIVSEAWNPNYKDKPLFESISLDSYFATGQNSQELKRQYPNELKDLNEKMYRDFYTVVTDACDQPEVTSLMNALDIMAKDIAEAKMVQIIENINNILTSRLIREDAIPERTCHEGGIWYRDDSYSHAKKRLANSSPRTISLATAKRLYDEALKNKNIAWGYKADGCYARAHIMARDFEEQGITVDKVWIKGVLNVPDENIQWDYHVAPVVYVEDKFGNVERMVIDPSLLDGPGTVEQWSATMQKGVIGKTITTQYPFPSNAANLERTAIAFSSSNPYSPFENLLESEEEKMDHALEIMKTYKGYSE